MGKVKSILSHELAEVRAQIPPAEPGAPPFLRALRKQLLQATSGDVRTVADELRKFNNALSKLSETVRRLKSRIPTKPSAAPAVRCATMLLGIVDGFLSSVK